MFDPNNDELVLCFPCITQTEKLINAYCETNGILNKGVFRTSQLIDLLNEKGEKNLYGILNAAVETSNSEEDYYVGHNLTGLFLPRSIVENILLIKQAIVAVFIYDYTGRLVMMKSLDGEMKGQYTLIEGHVSIPCDDNCSLNKVMSTPLKDFLYDNIVRELSEEVEISCNDMIFDCMLKHHFALDKKFKYVAYTDNIKEYISSKHIGFIYTLNLDNAFLDRFTFKAKEQCDEVTVINIKEVDLEFLDKCDSWSKEIIKDLANITFNMKID